MIFLENTSLVDYSTMRLGGRAKYLCSISNTTELEEALDFSKTKKLPVRVIGSGSNIIWSDKGYSGLVIINEIKGFSIKNNYLTAGAGELWDEVVSWSVDRELSGIENLSYIPGTAGATPVQNIGAYGREISEVLIYLKALDVQKNKIVTISNRQCRFGYRTSRFKTVDSGKFIILEITLKLSDKSPKPPFYESLRADLDNKKITKPKISDIRKSVMKIRKTKLPDVETVPNSGSFFTNPIISKTEFNKLVKTYPDIKGWDTNGQKKISAGWLIENAGFKDFHDDTTGMATWKHQSLVLVNEHANSTADLLKFKDKIVRKVKEKYNIRLEQEPEMVV